MRWWVETTALDGRGGPEVVVVHARTWREALQRIRGSGASEPIQGWEVVGSGFRTLDLEAGRRYLVFPQPPRAVLRAYLESEDRDPPPPSYEILLARDQEPTPELPLSYRERGVQMAPRVSRQQAILVLRYLLEEQRASLASHPPGKVIELAVFVGRVAPSVLPPLLASLSYRDWWPEVRLYLPPAPPARLPRRRSSPGRVTGR